MAAFGRQSSIRPSLEKPHQVMSAVTVSNFPEHKVAGRYAYVKLTLMQTVLKSVTKCHWKVMQRSSTQNYAIQILRCFILNSTQVSLTVLFLKYPANPGCVLFVSRTTIIPRLANIQGSGPVFSSGRGLIIQRGFFMILSSAIVLGWVIAFPRRTSVNGLFMKLHNIAINWYRMVRAVMAWSHAIPVTSTYRIVMTPILFCAILQPYSVGWFIGVVIK